MITKFVGMKDFRQNLASYTKKAKVKNLKYIIFKKNVPVLEVSPVNEKEFMREKLRSELEEAEVQIRKGEYYTQEEVMKEFGLL